MIFAFPTSSNNNTWCYDIEYIAFAGFVTTKQPLPCSFSSDFSDILHMPS